MAGLDEFWCSDCRTRSLFERVTADGQVAEWACTGCGAAYLDGIDVGVDPRGESVTEGGRSGVLAEHGVLVV